MSVNGQPVDNKTATEAATTAVPSATTPAVTTVMNTAAPEMIMATQNKTVLRFH